MEKIRIKLDKLLVSLEKKEKEYIKLNKQLEDTNLELDELVKANRAKTRELNKREKTLDAIADLSSYKRELDLKKTALENKEKAIKQMKIDAEGEIKLKMVEFEKKVLGLNKLEDRLKEKMAELALKEKTYKDKVVREFLKNKEKINA